MSGSSCDMAKRHVDPYDYRQRDRETDEAYAARIVRRCDFLEQELHEARADLLKATANHTADLSSVASERTEREREAIRDAAARVR